MLQWQAQLPSKGEQARRQARQLILQRQPSRAAESSPSMDWLEVADGAAPGD